MRTSSTKPNRRFLAESLFKNSAFLMLNLVLTTVCGYGALTLLTHLFSTKDVGLSATAVAACSLVTYITQLGTTYSLPRFLPTSKNRSEMINTLLTAVTVATLVLYAGHDVFIKPSMVEGIVATMPARDKTLRFFPASYHLLLHDYDRDTVLREIDRWLSRLLS